MREKSIFEYARIAARAEQRVLELLDKSLRDDLAETCPDLDLPPPARPRQGHQSSG